MTNQSTSLVKKLQNNVLFFLSKLIPQIKALNVKKQLSNLYIELGNTAQDKFPCAPSNSSFLPLQVEDNRLTLKIKHLQDTLQEKTLTHQSRKNEFNVLLHELSLKKKENKRKLSKLQNELRLNQNSLKIRQAIQNKKMKKYTLLTMFKDKSKFKNTLLDLEKLVSSTQDERDLCFQEYQNITSLISKNLREWSSLSVSLNEDITALKEEIKTLSKSHGHINKKIQDFYYNLGQTIDKENSYTDDLIHIKEQIQLLKSHLH